MRILTEQHLELLAEILEYLDDHTDGAEDASREERRAGSLAYRLRHTLPEVEETPR